MAKKSAAKKPAAKKPVAKKPVAKKPAPKKPAPKKPAAKKPAAKPAPKRSAPKVVAKKPVAKPTLSKVPSKKVPATKMVAKIITKVAVKGKAAPAALVKAKKVYIPDISRPTGSYGGVQLSDDPKPFPKKSPYGAKELDSLRKALQTESHRLRQELYNLETMATGGDGGHESHGHSLHIAEHASDLQSTETNIAMRALDEERLAQVDEALMRIKDRQHYGLCVACGDKIGIKRLIAKPHAQLCMDCRTKYERNRRY